MLRAWSLLYVLRAGGERAHLKPEQNAGLGAAARPGSGGQGALPSAPCQVWDVLPWLWCPRSTEGSIAAGCPGGLRQGVSLGENIALSEGGERLPLHLLNPQSGLCWARATAVDGKDFNSGRRHETGDGQTERALIMQMREGLLSERQPRCPPPVGRASVRACILLGTRKSHHKLQSQGSLHVFPAAWRAIYILVFDIARKLRTDLLFFSHTVSSSCWGDAGASGESRAGGYWWEWEETGEQGLCMAGCSQTGSQQREVVWDIWHVLHSLLFGWSWRMTNRCDA